MIKRKIIYKSLYFDNCFITSFVDIDSGESASLVIHKNRNDIVELMKFFLYSTKSCIWIGFGNLEFECQFFKRLINIASADTEVSADLIMANLSEVYESIQNKEFNNDRNSVQQIDLVKINYWGYQAKRLTLENANIFLNKQKINSTLSGLFLNDKDIDSAIECNERNLSTISSLYQYTTGINPIIDKTGFNPKNKILIREKIRKEYGVNCQNYPDVKLGESIMIKEFCKRKNISVLDLIHSDKRPENILDYKVTVPPWAKYRLKQFVDLTDKLNNLSQPINAMSFSYETIVNNIRFQFGLGGVHASNQSDVYKSDEDNLIIYQDVSSMYPHMVKHLNVYPCKFDGEFVTILSELLQKKLNEENKENKDQSTIDAIKASLVSIIGKTNLQESCLYDPVFFRKITISSQLFLAKWIDIILSNIDDVTIIFANTDGICYSIKRHNKDKALSISNKLEEFFQLKIKTVYVNKIIFKDVNNYIMQQEDGSINDIGMFEINKDIHKDDSKRIVRKAIFDYFINNIPVEQTVRNCKNIFDFCIRTNFDHSKPASFVHVQNNTIKSDVLNLYNRYFVSTSGGSILYGGQNILGDKTQRCITMFNDYYDSDNYFIDYSYYIQECQKLIDKIEIKQLKLF